MVAPLGLQPVGFTYISWERFIPEINIAMFLNNYVNSKISFAIIYLRTGTYLGKRFVLKFSFL